jgi:organic hydroperoxide reductase OsmC/OhrA
MPRPGGPDSIHRFHVRCTWAGSTAAGYEGYDRSHRATAPPAGTELSLSADPGFRGDPALLNPEQLVVLAAASCQLLSFLAVASRARIDVVGYEDDGEATMTVTSGPSRIDWIVLRPTIRVVGDVTEARIRRLVEVAHRECFIANSLRTEVRVEPTVVFLPPCGPPAL